MNFIHVLFLLLIVGQSVLFAQQDTIKKGFKPYGLIDAAPVAVSDADFKPPINITIQLVDALTNIPVNVTMDYYAFGEGIMSMKNGSIISLISNRNEKLIIILNAPGYLWQTQIFYTPEADTSLVLKLTRLKKGEMITMRAVDFNIKEPLVESPVYFDLLGLSGFLKINPAVKIQVVVCSKWKDDLYSFLIKNTDKKRFRFKNCRNPEQGSFETVSVKILCT